MQNRTLINHYYSGLLCFLILLTPGNASSQTIDTLSDEELINLFAYVQKQDVSNLRHIEIREHVFLSNFCALIRIIENQGFPSLKVEPRSRNKRSIIIRCSELILIHILQFKPERMLNDKIIRLFDLELKSKRMPAPVLQVPMTCMVDSDSTVNTFSTELQEKFYEAMEIWQLDFLPQND